jgi:hypothetical protein
MRDVAPTVLALYKNVLALCYTLRLKPKQGAFAAPICKANLQCQLEVFADFFLFAALRLLVEYESQRQ